MHTPQTTASYPEVIKAAVYVLDRLGVADKALKALRRYGRDVITPDFLEEEMARWEAALS